MSIPIGAGEEVEKKSPNVEDAMIRRASVDMDPEKADEKSAVDRGVWGSQVEFVMTCISYAGGFLLR